MRDPYSDYGSRYSTYSACDPYASRPPRVFDGSGRYYGELTVNRYSRDFISGLYDWLVFDVCDR
jgi:hypothetical protein